MYLGLQTVSNLLSQYLNICEISVHQIFRLACDNNVLNWLIIPKAAVLPTKGSLLSRTLPYIMSASNSSCASETVLISSCKLGDLKDRESTYLLNKYLSTYFIDTEIFVIPSRTTSTSNPKERKKYLVTIKIHYLVTYINNARLPRTNVNTTQYPTLPPFPSLRRLLSHIHDQYQHRVCCRRRPHHFNFPSAIGRPSPRACWRLVPFKRTRSTQGWTGHSSCTYLRSSCGVRNVGNAKEWNETL